VLGGGSVTVACNPTPANCTQATATAAAPSNGCVYDVSVYVTIGGVRSAAFTIAIVQPKNATLLSGYPTDSAYYIGYQTAYAWNVTDSCGYSDAGLDQGESFGSWTNVVANNWSNPGPYGVYEPTSTFYDYMSTQAAGVSPSVENPQSPRSTDRVFYAPWTLYAGSTVSGSGVAIHTDTSLYYRDHGRHCPSGSGCP